MSTFNTTYNQHVLPSKTPVSHVLHFAEWKNISQCPSAFNEWVAARYAVEKMCQEEFFTCPACTPDMLAVCVDGNRKHYRFKNTARYFSFFQVIFFILNDVLIYILNVFLDSTEKRGLLDHIFIQSDVEVSDFVDFVRKNNDHVSIMIYSMLAGITG